jgi:hypothetical protein
MADQKTDFEKLADRFGLADAVYLCDTGISDTKEASYLDSLTWPPDTLKLMKEARKEVQITLDSTINKHIGIHEYAYPYADQSTYEAGVIIWSTVEQPLLHAHTVWSNDWRDQ